MLHLSGITVTIPNNRNRIISSSPLQWLRLPEIWIPNYKDRIPVPGPGMGTVASQEFYSCLLTRAVCSHDWFLLATLPARDFLGFIYLLLGWVCCVRPGFSLWRLLLFGNRALELSGFSSYSSSLQHVGMGFCRQEY